jgi:transposase
MSRSSFSAMIATLGIDLGKNSFHLVGQDQRGAIVLRIKLSRPQLTQRLANIPPCLIGMEACAGAHHIGRQLQALGHDVRLIPAQYVKPFLKGHKNDHRDAEAIAEAVQFPGLTRSGPWITATRLARFACALDKLQGSRWAPRLCPSWMSSWMEQGASLGKK